MSEFNRMTVVAASEVVASFKSHDDMGVLEVQWGISGRCSATSKAARVASWAQLAIEESLEVMTEGGQMLLERAIIEIAITAPPRERNTTIWRKMLAGLRFDGVEVVENQIEVKGSVPWDSQTETIYTLNRILPADVPGLDSREAHDEVRSLLEKHKFSVVQGHLSQAVDAFSRGEWASSNAQMRNVLESCLNEIAVRLGCKKDDSKSKRDFLGELAPPFLLSEYNEWDANTQKPQYVQGLLSRLHPHGSHPGLSEEDDCTFRLQIVLITLRLFLRRFNQRKVQS